MRLLFLILLLPIQLSAQHSSSGSAAAIVFINSLDSVQKKKTVFAFEDMSRYEWHYLPATLVHSICFIILR
jgi:hypothetical protein